MVPTAMDIETLTERIIGCAIEVHRNLGPGLLESVYRECMVIELKESHLGVLRATYLKLTGCPRAFS